VSTVAPRISVQALGKRYVLGRKRAKRAVQRARVQRREVWALRDVSFDVAPGSVLGVIGANGAGKSTLLKVLARVTVPTEGRVVGHGRVVSLLELGAGYQPELTGRENVYLSAALNGIPRSAVDERMGAIAGFAQLGEFLDAEVKRYSSGMFLRLAFAAASHLEPDVLLADEVLAVGDIGFQERCLQRVREVREVGTTVLFVSHDMGVIRRICDSVMWLDSGRIMELGETNEVVEHYEADMWKAVRIAGWVVPEPTMPSESPPPLGTDSCGRYLHTRLLDDSGEEKSSVLAMEPLTVEITYRVDVAPAWVRLSVTLVAGDTIVFRTWSPNLLRVEAPKVIRFRVTIPADTLAAVDYLATVCVTVLPDHSTVQLNDVLQAFRFRAYMPDENPESDQLIRAIPAGVVAPRTEWIVDDELSLDVDELEELDDDFDMDPDDEF
jgi:lipopolysaccharide transport system ATP-binding protein